MPPSSTPAAPAEPATAPQAPSALLRSAPSWNSDGDDRERRRRDDRRAQALCGAGGDQLALGGGEARRRAKRPRRRAEPGHEDAAPAEQVGSPAAEQQEAAEGDHVGVHDPGQVRLREVEALADARQGDVDDRRVEHHDELRDAEQDQCGPRFVRDIPERFSSPSTPFVLCRLSDRRFTPTTNGGG